MLQENNNTNKLSELKLVNRNKLSLTNVEKVIGSNDTKIMVVVSGDTFCITGNNLRVLKLDTDSGLFESEGEVSEIKIMTGNKGGLFKKIFKWFCFLV